MKNIFVYLFILATISSLVRSDDTTGDLTTGVVGTSGYLTTTGALGTTGTTVVGSTTGTTGVIQYVSHFAPNSTLNVTLPVGDSGAVIDISLPAIEGAASVVYSQAAQGQKDYSNPASAPSGLSYKGISFVITILDTNGNEISGQLSQPIVIKLTNVQDPSANDAVYFYDTQTTKWTATETTCNSQCVCPNPATSVDVAGHSITTVTCHLTQFAAYEVSGDTTPVKKSNSSDNSMLAIVIIVPIVAVGIIIGIVAWALVRKRSNRSSTTPQMFNQVEMGNRKSAQQQGSQLQVPLTAPSKRAPDSSSDEETSDEEEETSEEEQQRGAKVNEEESESDEESSSSSSDDESSSDNDHKSSSSSTSDSE